MSSFNLALRLIGDVDALEATVRLAEGFLEPVPKRLHRQGEPRPWGVQPVNVLLFPLAEWRRGAVYDGEDREAILAEERAQLAHATAVVTQLTPHLAALDRSRTTADLYISTVRTEELGGLDLPADLVAASAAARLSIALSIAVAAWPDDDEHPEEDVETDPQEETPEPT
jgi:hypothetical protein